MSETFLNVIALAIVASGIALNETPTKNIDQDSLVVKEVRQVDNDRVKAMLHGDTAALDRICADDLIYTHSDGTVETKAQWIESIKSGNQRYETFNRDNVQVRVYGSAAVVTGRSQVKIFSGGQEKSFQIRFAAMYAKLRGAWRLVAWQSTRIAQ